MRIAYLILCHRDPVHIARLAAKLTSGDDACTVFIHVDAKSDIAEPLAALMQGRDRIVLVEPRVAVYWSGFSAVEATYVLLNAAVRHGAFDRFAILQGADYPLRSPAAIRALFAADPEREYLRACDTTIARTRHLRAKSRYILLMDRPNLLKKAWNRLADRLDLRLARPTVRVDGRDWQLYWGAAQIAFTRPLADLFLACEHHPALRRRFRHSLAPEETWFHTIAYNSDFRDRTITLVPETPTTRLGDVRGIAYFEYRGVVTLFAEEDLARLRQVEEPFIRKVSTEVSTALLDRIDGLHAAEDGSFPRSH